jgi:predicted MFS family arabinose efflux permease
MHGRYRALLRRPGAVGLVGSGLPARLPIATYGIGLLALARERCGSFDVAGSVVAAYTLAAVVSGLFVGRLVQRLWFPTLLRVLALLDAAALVVGVVAIHCHAPLALILTAAAVIGLLLPPVGVVVRNRWSSLTTDPVELHLALFLESALDEAVFVVGPAMIGGMGVAVGPEAALLAAAAIATVGGVGLSRFRGGAPVRVAGDGAGAGRGAALPRLYLGVGALGIAFAAIQVGVFTSTRAEGTPGSAGVVLTGFSVVSLVAGLAVGSRGRIGTLRQGLALLGAALVIPAVLAGSPLVLALLLAPAACAASPSVAVGFAQAARTVAADRRGVALAWCGAALSTGLAVGSAGAGAVADRAGGSAVLLAGALVALVAALLCPRSDLAGRGGAARDSSHAVRVGAAGTGPGD